MVDSESEGATLSARLVRRLGIESAYSRLVAVLQRQFQYKYRLYRWFYPYVRIYFELLGIATLITALYSPDRARELLDWGADIPLYVIEFGQRQPLFVLALFTASYLYHVRDKHRQRDLTTPPTPNRFVRRVGVGRLYRWAGVVMGTIVILFAAVAASSFLLVIFVVTAVIFTWYLLPHKLISDAAGADGGRPIWVWEFASQYPFLVAAYYFLERIPRGEFDQLFGGQGSDIAVVGLTMPLFVFVLLAGVSRYHGRFSSTPVTDVTSE